MSKSDPLDRLVTFGKYKDTNATWRQVVERDTEYALWLVDHAEALPDDVREAMQEELDGMEWGFAK